MDAFNPVVVRLCLYPEGVLNVVLVLTLSSSPDKAKLFVVIMLFINDTKEQSGILVKVGINQHLNFDRIKELTEVCVIYAEVRSYVFMRNLL